MNFIFDVNKDKIKMLSCIYTIFILSCFLSLDNYYLDILKRLCVVLLIFVHIYINKEHFNEIESKISVNKTVLLSMLMFLVYHVVWIIFENICDTNTSSSSKIVEVMNIKSFINNVFLYFYVGFTEEFFKIGLISILFYYIHNKCISVILTCCIFASLHILQYGFMCFFPIAIITAIWYMIFFRTFDLLSLVMVHFLVDFCCCLYEESADPIYIFMYSLLFYLIILIIKKSLKTFTFV